MTMTTAIARETPTRAAPQPTTCFARVSTPVGPLLLVGARADSTRDEGALVVSGIYFGDAPHAARAIALGAKEDQSAFTTLRAQLDEYFAGTRRQFDLALAPQGTSFQLRIWKALAAIPYGQTATYADIARATGQPDAVRAVGAANGKNPLSIVVPCHRVIGKDGTLTGYAGGLAIKRHLLELESAHRT